MGGRGQFRDPLRKIKEKIAQGKLSKTVNPDSHNKHVEGTRQYDDYYKSKTNKKLGPPSIIDLDVEEVQGLVDALLKGLYDRNIISVEGNKVYADFGFEIGKIVFKDKTSIPTNVGLVSFSRTGAHISPAGKKP